VLFRSRCKENSVGCDAGDLPDPPMNRLLRDALEIGARVGEPCCDDGVQSPAIAADVSDEILESIDRLFGITANGRGDAPFFRCGHKTPEWLGAEELMDRGKRVHLAERLDEPVRKDNVQAESTQFGNDWTSQLGATRNDGEGFVASASSQAAWAYGPASPGIGNPFTSVAITGSSMLTAESFGASQNIVNTRFEMQLNVTVSSDTTWSFVGDIMGEGTNTGSGTSLTRWSIDVLKLGGFFPTRIDGFINNVVGGGTIQDAANVSGDIEAGDYIFVISLGTGADFLEESVAGTAVASIALENGLLSFVPAPGATGIFAFGLIAASRRRRTRL